MTLNNVEDPFMIQGLVSAFCRRNVNDLLLCLLAEDSGDEHDEDTEILLVDALSKEPFPFSKGFKIDLNKIDEQRSIDLFRYNA